MFSKNQISEMTKAIVQAVKPVYIILFGSYGRGDMRNASDIDLLVVEREGFGEGRSRWEEIKAIRKALRSFKGAKDILVYSREEADKLRDSINHVVGEAFREGEILYEA
jgi:predicted nucleotidyltransferase